MPLIKADLELSLSTAFVSNATPTGTSDNAASSWVLAIHSYSSKAVSCSGTVTLNQSSLEQDLKSVFNPSTPPSNYTDPADDIASAWKNYWSTGIFGSGNLDLVSLNAAYVYLKTQLASQFASNANNPTVTFASTSSGIAGAIDTATRMINITGPLPCPGKLV